MTNNNKYLNKLRDKLTLWIVIFFSLDEETKAQLVQVTSK